MAIPLANPNKIICNRYGKLVVTDFVGVLGKLGSCFKCRCDCGRVLTVKYSFLTHGKQFRSCGVCDDSFVYKRSLESTGFARTPEYKAYKAMLYRCNNSAHASYKHYGGRGIKVCDRWTKSVHYFLFDMGKRPSDQHSLDRINVDGNYEPSNCRWATCTEQINNRRRIHTLQEENDALKLEIERLQTLTK